ncbi:MAG: single-stranded-DNA-specific exonuclease RecJ [Chloroflexota bacterium]
MLTHLPADRAPRGHKAAWQIAPQIPEEMLRKLSGLSPMLCHLVYARGYRTVEEILDFFRVGDQPHDPGLLPDMERAIVRIADAVRQKQTVAIYGDFDCDGLTSAVILVETLQGYGLDPLVHIPTRDEGHGLHHAALLALAEQRVDLVITSDCGVTAITEVETARALGIDVIITDHHEARADGSIPDCPVVNPTRQDSLYPCRHLCAVGVAYKLARALAAVVPGGSDPDALLDLVALGTVADVVPLRGENRWLVIEGLRRLQKTERPGLGALFTVAGVDRSKIDPVSIGYYLAPRVNAANRLATPQLAYELLTAPDRNTGLALAQRLTEYNRQRQDLVERYMEAIVERLGDPTALMAAVTRGDRPPALIEIGEWPAGISGLLASKLVDRYGVPAFIGSAGDDGVIGVSARGIEGVYIDEILEACEMFLPDGLFLTYGGHARAGGFRVDSARWDETLAILDAQLREHVVVGTVGRSFVIDAEASLRKLSLSAARQIQTLAPFGNGFGEPLFLVRDATLRRIKPVGEEGRHAKLTLQQADTRIDAVHFNADDEFFDLPRDARIDVLCHLQVNEWRGASRPELRVRDWRLAA